MRDAPPRRKSQKKKKRKEPKEKKKSRELALIGKNIHTYILFITDMEEIYLRIFLLLRGD